MAAFLPAALLGSVVLVQTGRAWVLAGAGLAVGLAMACKLTAAPMLLLPLAPMILDFGFWILDRVRSLRAPAKASTPESEAGSDTHSKIQNPKSKILLVLLVLLVLG